MLRFIPIHFSNFLIVLGIEISRKFDWDEQCGKIAHTAKIETELFASDALTLSTLCLPSAVKRFFFCLSHTLLNAGQ